MTDLNQGFNFEESLWVLKFKTPYSSGGLLYLQKELNFVFFFTIYFLFYLKDFVDGCKGVLKRRLNEFV